MRNFDGLTETVSVTFEDLGLDRQKLLEAFNQVEAATNSQIPWQERDALLAKASEITRFFRNDEDFASLAKKYQEKVSGFRQEGPSA